MCSEIKQYFFSYLGRTYYDVQDDISSAIVDNFDKNDNPTAKSNEVENLFYDLYTDITSDFKYRNVGSDEIILTV